MKRLGYYLYSGLRHFGRKTIAISANANERTFTYRYGLATLFVVVAFYMRRILNPELHNELAFTFFISSSILAAFFAGFGAGLYALGLGWFLADYFFIPPVGVIGRYGKVQLISLLSDFGPALFAIILIQVLHIARRNAAEELKARKRAESELANAKRNLECVNTELEQRVADRTAELEKSVRFLEGFCYSIAHDLRAPLRAMQGFVVALHEDYAQQLDEMGKQYTSRIFAAAQRMDRLVLDLLDYGRLNHARLDIKDVSLDRTMTDVLEQLGGVVLDTGARIQIDYPLLDVRGDPMLVELVLYHLIKNGLKFHRPEVPPRMRVWSEERGGCVRIWVKDNGVGIDPVYQERIFRLFETLQPTSTSATGVGLALVSKAIERMRGRLGLESQVGRGSTFWFELPKATEPPRGDEEEAVKQRFAESHP